MEEIKRFSKYWKELKNSFFLLDLSKAASNAGTLSRNCTLGEFIFRFHLIGKPRRFRFHFQGGVSNFRTSGVLLNRGLLGPVEGCRPTGTCETHTFFVRKRGISMISSRTRNKHITLWRNLFYTRNEISNSLKKSMIPLVRLFRRFRSLLIYGLVSPKPRSYFPIVTRPNASYKENIGSSFIKPEACCVIVSYT